LNTNATEWTSNARYVLILVYQFFLLCYICALFSAY
jgi:hypothetical protein